MPRFASAEEGATRLAQHCSHARPHAAGWPAHGPAPLAPIPPLARPTAGARRTRRPTAEVPTHG